ncbi:hypothetical protein C5F48_20220 [Cereibacter changlensis JA139]|uniref:Transcription elongation factor GreA/GreB C-terminal domain-containing protein n=2 Tax=Cereibacter changlensis TaxID=402884 RepID=A0A2T4JPU5_9RHOB|nr:hypothetical protein [Cereibacter changlensis]PTE19940.1 hypothetical protein C5F48_20220 [Cereibacter changlensis JA139]PZX56375.1 hypothetical protein LX76_01404 [Cereibacter changlensis]
MHCHPTAPQPKGEAALFDGHSSGSRPRAGGMPKVRPARALLSRHDYWQLNEHRRRCEELGGPRFARLARLIRAKLLDARVTEAGDLAADVVTGTSRATFVLDHQRPETCQLYHWYYPGDGSRPMPVGSFLGVTLIGLAVGQRRRFVDGNRATGEVQVLAVHPQGRTGANLFD